MSKYEISEDEFPSIKQALELVFKEEDYDSIVNVSQETLPQSPDDVYLNQFDKRIHKMVERLSRDHDRIYTFVASSPNKYKKTRFVYQFVRNRATQQWTFDAKLTRGGYDKYVNKTYSILLAGTIVIPGIGLGIVATVGGMKLFMSIPARAMLMLGSRKVKSLITKVSSK
ncbi:hypothetical protein HLG73_14620 [Lacticaseibacillus paracasei]|uniref:hypothetical protein n=1 Tax=Lacticaseibacillus paracasei TaxID=1597 RepID=UPI0023587E44|nr:hypothetical protein [Lacticaseibacillus paracasei]WCZ17856.1 hypothetical protein HLG73_14620 [Lacticaseibacillus paracasei]